MARLPAGSRSGHGHQRQVAEGRSDGARLQRIADDPVVERPVRLDVGDVDAGGACGGAQGLDLLGDPVGQHGGRDVHRLPPEALAVAVGDLGAYDHPARGSSLADGPHQRLVAGVEAARDVGAGHHREQAGVVGHALPQIGIEVDPPGRRLRTTVERSHGTSVTALLRSG